MHTYLSLRNGAMRCEIIPALGGCIAGWWCGKEPVLQSTPAHLLQSVRQAASFALVPFSNRIGNAHMHWQGHDYTLTQNFAPEPHAIHGLGWERPWRVKECSDAQAVLDLDHTADAAWPFSFAAQQTLTLHPGALHMALQITNQSAHAAPVGLGWHPYFVKRPGATLAFNCTAKWEMGADQLPTHRTEVQSVHQTCDQLHIDHCFEGWQGHAVLQDAVHRCTISADMCRLVAYTHPELGAIAIEPVSHVNNALQLANENTSHAQLGVQTLQPGETFACAMQIAVEIQ